MNPTSLPRIIGPWMAGAVVVGTVIGSGVFKKGRNVAEQCPEFALAISVWVVVGLLSLMGALAIAEVAVRLPKAGGNYAFLRDAYGRWAGFLWGWVDFGIIRTSSIGVLSVMFVESLSDVLVLVNGQGLDRLVRVAGSLAVIAGLTLVNIRGTRIGGGLQMFLTILKVGSILALMALPFAVFLFPPATEHRPSLSNFPPIWPDITAIDWSKYGIAVVGVLWAYHGWLNITPIAEEVKEPQRNIPRALLGGMFVLIFLYVGANVAYYSAVTGAEMAAKTGGSLSSTPLSTEFCARLLGSAGVIVASLILMTSVFGSLNGNILVAPRLLYAMSDDGLSPKTLREVHARYLTPAKAMLVFSGWSMLLVVVAEVAKELKVIDPGKSVFDILTDYCVVGGIMFETLGVASIFVLRRIQRDRTASLPYRCPGYPVVPAIYILFMAAVLANMFIGTSQRTEAIVGSCYAALGACVYFLFLRRRG